MVLGLGPVISKIREKNITLCDVLMYQKSGVFAALFFMFSIFYFPLIALMTSRVNSFRGIARYFSQFVTSSLSTPAAKCLSFNFFLTELKSMPSSPVGLISETA